MYPHPQRYVYILTPAPMTVTSFGKRVFTAKLKILRWNPPGLSNRALNPMTNVHIRDRKGEAQTPRRKQDKDWGRGWSDVATGQEKSGATRSWKTPGKNSALVVKQVEAQERKYWVLSRHLDLGLLAARTVRGSLCVILSHQGVGISSLRKLEQCHVAVPQLPRGSQAQAVCRLRRAMPGKEPHISAL